MRSNPISTTQRASSSNAATISFFGTTKFIIAAMASSSRQGGGEEDASRRMLIEGNYLYDNGTTTRRGRANRDHNAYTEALGIVTSGTGLAPFHEDIQLKDRSTGNVIRYNWFEGGRGVLDIVEPEGSEDLPRRKSPGSTNVCLRKRHDRRPEVASSRLIHYGGDDGDTRKGTLFFYDNTIWIEHVGQGPVERFDPQSRDQRRDGDGAQQHRLFVERREPLSGSSSTAR